MAHLVLPTWIVFLCAVSCSVTGHIRPFHTEHRHAVCDLVPGSDAKVTGTIRMSQIVGGYGPGHHPIQVDVQVHGLDASDDNVEHGMHVHEYGDVSDACRGAGGHYNPLNTDHGARTDPPFRRHVGDWGNMPEVGGAINTKFNDFLAALYGPFSIAGRAIVLHMKADDLGRGGDAGSMASGNAGSRLACCIVRLVKG